MEFVSKDADMVLVKTSPEELKKLAAIMRACHAYDPVMCEMDGEQLLALAGRLEQADENSWVFHEIDILYLFSILSLARTLPNSGARARLFAQIGESNIIALHQDLETINTLKHSA